MLYGKQTRSQQEDLRTSLPSRWRVGMGRPRDLIRPDRNLFSFSTNHDTQGRRRRPRSRVDKDMRWSRNSCSSVRPGYLADTRKSSK